MAKEVTMDLVSIENIGIKVTPATVEAPTIKQVQAEVHAMLENIKEFVVVPETEKAAKEQRTKIRKFVQSLKDFRNDKAAILLKEWIAVEEVIKEIESDGNEVDRVLKEQLDQLTADKKAKKKKMVDDEITKIAQEFAIEYDEIEFNPKWLNVSYAWTNMQEEIAGQCENIKREKELFELRKSQIVNWAAELQIESAGYIHLINSNDIDSIHKQMKDDVQKEKDRLEAKEAIAQAEAERAERLASQQPTAVTADENGEVIRKVVKKPAPEVRKNYQFNIKNMSTTQRDWLIKKFNEGGLEFKFKEVE